MMVKHVRYREGNVISRDVIREFHGNGREDQ